MKCDKLESYYYYEDRVFTPATHTYRVYHADEVDAAIAELKAEIESLKASAYADSVDAELKADKTFVFGEECEAYKKSEADKVIAELEESHKKEVEQLLIEIVKLKADYKEACDRIAMEV